MPSFAGLRGTGDWGTDERPKNFREMILWANPNGSAPLTALMAKMRKQTTDDPEFAWFEEKLTPIRITTSADLSAASTTVTTASGALQLVAGDVLQIEKTETATYDNELVQVVSVASDTSFVITRAVAGSSAAGLTSGGFMTKIGAAFQEGTGAPNISQRNPTKLKNYTQIFKTAVGITGTADHTRARTGDAYQNDKKRKAFDHSAAMEYAWFWGRSAEDLTGTKPKRFTGGIRSFLSTNVKVSTSTPTEDEFIDFVNGLITYTGAGGGGGAGDERLVFTGNKAWTALNKLARNSSTSRLFYDGVIDIYGVRLQKWVTPTCTIGVKTHPLFNTHPRYSGSMFFLDPTTIIYRPLGGRDTAFQDNIQANDVDARQGQWLTEAGLEVEHEWKNGYWGNFTVP